MATSSNRPNNSGSGGGGGGSVVPLPGQFVVACVDYDARVIPGNDATGNYGAATTLAAALTLAQLTPFKTYERASQVLPSNGNGALLYVLGKGRTGGASYRNVANTADQTGAWRNNLMNYGRIICRSTGDFSDSAADRIQCGFVPVSGTNAGGYNPTAGATANTIPCQLNGGGAAALPAEGGGSGTSTITGYRIRFDANTATAALRNVCGSIWSNTTSQIVVGFNLAAVPSTSDVFYIETTELQFGASTSHLADVAVNYQITGERYSATGIVKSSSSIAVIFSGCEQSSGTFSANQLQSLIFQANALLPDGTFVNVGIGGRLAGGNVTMSDIVNVAITSTAVVAGGLNLASNIQRYASLGFAAVFAAGFNDGNGPGIGSNSTSTNQPAQRSLSLVGATFQRLRITGNSAFSAAILVNSSGIEIHGVDISNQTVPLIQIGGPQTVAQGITAVVDDLVSSGGNNTGPVLKMGGQDCTVRWGLTNANTATAARDIDLSNGAAVGTFAGLATTNYVDSFGNNVVGPAGVIVDKPGKIYTNRVTTAAIGQVLQSNGTSGECTIARADTVAHAASLIGVAMTGAASGAGILVATPGSHAAVQFDSAPTAGNIGYLSTATAGNAQAAAPAISGTNQKNRLGIVAAVTGSFGYMTFTPDKLAVIADNNP